MKKVMFAIVAFLLLSITAYAALAQECTDCCDGGPCGYEEEVPEPLQLYECEVEVNGDEIYPSDSSQEKVERGEDLEIDVRLKAMADVEDVQITAILTGYHRREQLVDMTKSFDMEAGDKDTFELNLHVPEDWDIEKGDDDIVYLRLLISDDSHATTEYEYKLRFVAKDNDVVIQDIILDPSSRVEAGRGLFASVRVKNMGEADEDSVKITTSIPALDLKATEYIDELDEDDATTSEDMFLRIPSCTEAGEYVVVASVEFADGDELVSKQTTIEILENPECGLARPSSDEETVVKVPGKQDVVIGTTGTVYPIILENRGVTRKAYELSVSGLDSWATYRFDPGTYVLLDEGEMQTIYLYVSANEDAPVGEKIFMVSVEAGNDQEQVALTANVVAGDSDSPFGGDWDKVKTGLEVGLVVLVVLVVILLLIIGFNKLKGSEEPEEVSGQTYY